MDTHNKENHFFLTAIFSFMIGVFILLLILVLLMKRANDAQLQSLGSADMITNGYQPNNKSFAPTGRGVFTLTAKAAKPAYVAGDILTLVLTASSDNQVVSGYDAVLTYDEERLQFITAKNLQIDFETFVKDRPGAPLFFTGVKKISAQKPMVFDQTVLAELTFGVKLKVENNLEVVNQKPIDIGLEFIPGSTRDSNIINTDNLDILYQTNGLSILVSPLQQPLNLYNDDF